MSDVLVILGMHRSGTSLLARYLAVSGVFMGYRLLGQHVTNPAGHYEDKDFLSLHNDLLGANGVDYKVVEKIPWRISPEFRSRAEQLISDRQRYAVWGWKDPRTCLFLDFWKDLVPNASYLICYRHYLPVIQSLITRDITFYRELTSRFQRWRHPRYRAAEINEMANTYLRVWIRYNSEILSHINTPGCRFVLTPFDDLVKGTNNRLEVLRKDGILPETIQHFVPTESRSRKRLKWDFTLDPMSMTEAGNLDAQFQMILQSSIP